MTGRLPSSGLLVRPAITNPAARWRLTSVVSIADTGGAAANALLPFVSGMPAMLAKRSLRRNGTPLNGPSGSSADAAASRASVEPAQHDRVDRGVVALDAFDRGVEQFDRRELALGDELGLLGGVHPTCVICE